MMRFLFLCLLLLLPSASAVSEETEGSATGGPVDDDDDEDSTDIPKLHDGTFKATGVTDSQDQFTVIVIIVAVAMLTLSGAAIVAILLVRRHMRNRQQGIYSVPTEQVQKGDV